MADKAILDVELNTSAFDAFRARFDAYRAKAAETPGAWAEVGKTTETTARSFDRLVASMAGMQTALAVVEQKTEDAGVEQSAAGERWTRIASSAKVFGSNIKDASLSLAKWTGLTSLFAGILSAGGLYGISRMATGVGARRTAAMSYGMSYGEYQSYRTNFERLGNMGGLLAGFNNAMTNIEDRAPLYALLGSGADKRLEGKSAAAALADALPDIKRYVDSLDPRTMGTVLHARGLDRIGLDLQTAQTFRRMSPKEVEQVASGFRTDVDPLGLPPEMAKQWQDFSTALDQAGAEIENHFAVNLVNLEPGLAALAASTADLVDHMLRDGGPVEGWLKRVDIGLEGLADKIGSKDSIAAIGRFVKLVADVGSVIGQIVARTNPFKIALGVGEEAVKVGGYVFGGDADADTRIWFRRHNPFAADYRTKLEYWKKYGGPKPVDDDAEDSERWQRYKTQNISEILTQGGDKVGIRPGRSPDVAHLDPRLVDLFAAGARHMPPGYKVLISEGYNPNGHVPGSMHHKAGQGAIDFVIVGPDGREIPNAGGNDPTGMYTLMHRHMEGELRARYPHLTGRMGHGADFGTGRGSGRRDWMHVDLGGSRGDGLIERLGPVPGEHYGPDGTKRASGAPKHSARVRMLHPHLHGQTNHVHIDDETGSADVHVQGRGVGPMVY